MDFPALSLVENHGRDIGVDRPRVREGIRGGSKRTKIEILITAEEILEKPKKIA